MQALLLPIANPSTLLGAPTATVQAYGVKSAGDVVLHQLQPGSPYPYDIPEAYAIPPRRHAGYISDDISRTFQTLIQGRTKRGVLMARSSAIGEESGQNDTLMTPFDPADIPQSKRRFLTAVEQMLDSSRDMGVLATRMVGTARKLEDGTDAFGFDNVSFSADTHCPFDLRQLYIALAHGLGTRTVAGCEDFIPVTAMLESGLITFIGNKNDDIILRLHSSADFVIDPHEYRARNADCFNLRTGQVDTHKLEFSFLRGLILNSMHIIDGRLVHYTETKEHNLGLMPLESPLAIMHLIDILRYIVQTKGSSQIEGAFLNGNSLIPSIYQYLNVPPVQPSGAPLTIEKSHLSSSNVIGSVSFKGPLVFFNGPENGWSNDKTRELLFQLDERFKESGYILLSLSHDRDFIRLTKNCRIRLSRFLENPSSHAVTFMRQKMGSDPTGGYSIAVHVSATDEFYNLTPSETFAFDGGMIGIYNAHLESNGAEMALQVLD